MQFADYSPGRQCTSELCHPVSRSLRRRRFTRRWLVGASQAAMGEVSSPEHLPPIKVVVAMGEEDVTLKVRDETRHTPIRCRVPLALCACVDLAAD